MSIHSCDAIVLRQYPYRETSLIVTCLTDRFGKIRGLIKGLRGEGSVRFRSAMESLSLNHIVFYDTRSSALHLVTQCELLRSYHELSRDLSIIHLGYYFAELIDSLIELDEPQAEVFSLLKESLERLSGMPSDRSLAVKIHFVLRLLRLSGFHPQLDECASCASHPASSKGFWSMRQGGLLCQRCIHEDPKAEEVTSEWLEHLSLIADSDAPVEIEPKYRYQTEKRLDEFLGWRLERPLKTTKMVAA